MRHLWSLLAGLVAAPLAWVLIAAGQGGSTSTITGWNDAGSYHWGKLIEPAVYLAVVGVLLGLIGTLRISPAGPMLAGVLLIAPYAALFARPFAVFHAVPDNRTLFGEPLPLRLPLENGTLLLIGALLLMATFSIKRWRRWPSGTADADSDTATDGTAGTSGTFGSLSGQEKDTRSLTNWPPKDSETTKPLARDSEPALASASTSRLPKAESSEPASSPWSVPPRGKGGRARR